MLGCIEKTLVLSTAHVSPTTAHALNSADLHGSLTVDTRQNLPAYYAILKAPPPAPPDWAPQLAWDHGWSWWVDGAADCVDFPPEFAAIFKLAADHGCKWVRFDCDAEIIAGLPTWEW